MNDKVVHQLYYDSGNCRRNKVHSSHVSSLHTCPKWEHHNLYPCHYGAKCAVSRHYIVHEPFLCDEPNKTINKKIV